MNECRAPYRGSAVAGRRQSLRRCDPLERQSEAVTLASGSLAAGVAPSCVEVGLWVRTACWVGTAALAETVSSGETWESGSHITGWSAARAACRGAVR
jgi:hypothetical protein